MNTIEYDIPRQLVKVEAAVPQFPLGTGVSIVVARGCFDFALVICHGYLLQKKSSLAMKHITFENVNVTFITFDISNTKYH